MNAIPTAMTPSPAEVPDMIEAAALAGSRAGVHAVARALDDIAALAMDDDRDTPMPEGTPHEVLAAVAEALGPAVAPVDGVGAQVALRRVATVLHRLGVALEHPRTAAHLQTATLPVAVAADALVSATNASLDSYDGGPSAVGIELWVVRMLTRLAGFGEHASGVLTPGGSQSNLMALLLARDAVAARLGIDVRREGVAGLPDPVVFCSELAHFSLARAAATLGLGERSIRAVPVDARQRMRVDRLAEMLADLRPGETPVAVVATAGTTGYGSIDPLPQIAGLAHEHGLWMHVDAAYGFGATFSTALAPKLAGVELADSITVDMHKVGWQPTASSALLVADASAFAVLDREVAYLNPADDVDAGYDGLLGRSLQSTRRADAVKVAVTLLAYGTSGLGSLVDTCHALARHAEARIVAEPRLELISSAELTTVTFRFVGDGHLDTADTAAADTVNGEIRRRLAERGHALIGRTETAAASAVGVALKMTLLNPTATTSDIDAIVDLVLEVGAECLAGAAPVAAVAR